MPKSGHLAKTLSHCSRPSTYYGAGITARPLKRLFATTLRQHNEVTTGPNPLDEYDPATVTSRKGEAILMKTATKPIGSRRRRAALASSQNIPFEQLPYQCFQEARKVLLDDREDKIRQIEVMRQRIARVREQDATIVGGDLAKQKRLRSMHNHLEELKIFADINDPLIKKRFEDGDGDMNRPIYRHLANKKWREYQRPLMEQRIMQMSVVPDVLQSLGLKADVRLGFQRKSIQPGDFVGSCISQFTPRLRVQVFDKGKRLVTVVVIDSDVPDLNKDSFGYRCHFLAANIPISPTTPVIPLSRLSADSQLIFPWLPPVVQKGSPYHRLSTFVLQQPEGSHIDISKLRDRYAREGFKLRSLLDVASLKPIGAHLFRSVWDEGTAEIMRKFGIEGADVEFRRKRVESLVKKQLPLKKKENRPGLPSKRL